MQIKKRTFELISVAVGLALVANIAYGLKTNPRWAHDTGPGVGLLPRGIVLAYLAQAYGDAGAAQAAKLYFDAHLTDHTPQAQDPQNIALRHTVKAVVAEGLNVVVFHCIESASGGQATDVVDIFRAANGRITDRTRAAAQPASTCAITPAADSKAPKR